jgi:hypothetical protein
MYEGDIESDREDFERMIDLFDRVLTSDDQRVINAFKSLMVIVALTENADDSKVRVPGPFRYLNDQVYDLSQRIRKLEITVHNPTPHLRDITWRKDPYAKDYYQDVVTTDAAGYDYRSANTNTETGISDYMKKFLMDENYTNWSKK